MSNCWQLEAQARYASPVHLGVSHPGNSFIFIMDIKMFPGPFHLPLRDKLLVIRDNLTLSSSQYFIFDVLRRKPGEEKASH